MFADLLLEGAVTRIEGPLLFARRKARVGLNAAVEVLAGSGPSAISTIASAPVLAGELQLDARGMFIRWQSTGGQAYRVEFKETLTDPDWVPLGIDILGYGDVLAVRVPTTVHPQRFYRLRVVEQSATLVQPA